MTGEEVGDTWHTFNKYFDALFAEIWQKCVNITMGHWMTSHRLDLIEIE